MKFKYLLFDLDGTLTNPALGITNSIAYALKKNNIEPPEREKLYKYIGPPLIDSFMEDYGFSRDGAVKALWDYREYYEEAGIFENSVYDGIDDLLKSLAENGKKIYLATSKPEIYAKQILEHFNLAQYFTFIAGNTMAEDRHHKVDVINYLYSECPEIKRDEAVMVGDRNYDVIGAHKAGIKCVGVLFGFGDMAEMQAAGADFIAPTVCDLKNILLGE